MKMIPTTQNGSVKTSSFLPLEELLHCKRLELKLKLPLLLYFTPLDKDYKEALIV